MGEACQVSQSSYNLGEKAIPQYGGVGIEGLITSARWKQFKQMMTRLCRVFADAGSFLEVAWLYVCQGWDLCLNDLLWAREDLLKSFHVSYCAAKIPHTNAVCQDAVYGEVECRDTIVGKEEVEDGVHYISLWCSSAQSYSGGQAAQSYQLSTLTGSLGSIHTVVSCGLAGGVWKWACWEWQCWKQSCSPQLASSPMSPVTPGESGQCGDLRWCPL